MQSKVLRPCAVCCMVRMYSHSERKVESDVEPGRGASTLLTLTKYRPQSSTAHLVWQVRLSLFQMI
jgi:hypothetical protein